MKNFISIIILGFSFISVLAQAPKREVNPEAKLFVFSETIEKERPELDEETKQLLSIYRKNPTTENFAKLREKIAKNYDAVVERKKAKLEDLKQTARYESQVKEMQDIVDEMVENRELRLNQMIARLTDERNAPQFRNENADYHPVLGAKTKISIAHLPVTNSEYAEFLGKKVKEGEENLPVVNVSISDIKKYCKWLSEKDRCVYRLPTEEEWELAAGHMPKDADFNAEDAKRIVDVGTYPQTPGACGGLDFWGNIWEWTSTESNDKGSNYVKGGAFDSKRTECRTESLAETRKITGRFANVGFRLVREDE